MSKTSASDVDNFTYDPNACRPTNLAYAINPTSNAFSVKTPLTWNGGCPRSR